MGNQTNYHCISKYFHPTLGQVSIIVTNCHKKLAISVPAYDKMIYYDWVANVSKFKSDNCPRQCILLPQFHQYKQPNILCDSYGKIHITFEYHPQTLKELNLKKIQQHQYHKQRYLLYIVNILVKVGKFFHRTGQRVGNIHPNNLLYNQKRQLKVISTLSTPICIDNLKQIMKKPPSLFLSPQQLHSILQPQTLFNIDVYLCQSFSIGITLLQCATLSECSALYDYQKCTFNNLKLQQLLKSIKQRYSQQLYKIIQGLVMINPNERLSLANLSQKLQKMQYKITNKNCFDSGFSNSIDQIDNSLNYQLIKNQESYFNISNGSINSKQTTKSPFNRFTIGYNYQHKTY